MGGLPEVILALGQVSRTRPSGGEGPRRQKKVRASIERIPAKTAGILRPSPRGAAGGRISPWSLSLLTARHGGKEAHFATAWETCNRTPTSPPRYLNSACRAKAA